MKVVQIYFDILIKIKIITYFLTIFLLLFFHFPSWIHADPDQQP